MPPAEGETAPDVEGLYCDGETFRTRTVSDVTGGRGTVLVFGGFVFSAIATNWWSRYESAGWDDVDGVNVVGIHRDGPYAVNAFIRSDDRPFDMFADVEGSMADAYGLRTHREGMADATTAHRGLFVLDDSMTVTAAWVADDWISPAPRRRIEAAVGAL
jgi:peroxiredoxin